MAWQHDALRFAGGTITPLDIHVNLDRTGVEGSRAMRLVLDEEISTVEVGERYLVIGHVDACSELVQSVGRKVFETETTL
ncbi:hypothetical protein [Kocuria palustris]|uniref:hypothetical protein n=1 Tax=Kocuria palustris TaxID=71999 RepID=UPI0006AA4D2F|nr:hypothetical protein [Kocuria palustris]ALB03371.1 hypothetical protein KPaMU14_07510 [Kocuria palustris]